ncbi:hypothetical protein M0657_003080 [Pyricularia oryzae]|nr:hypothetical protein M0657_003080 [Pyricularia oryzae]KAI7930682.1 hypothetical protein M9X92_000746 [Pyricularia oryzae]
MAAVICEGSRLLQKSQGYLAGWLTVPAARYQHLSNAMMVAKIMSVRRLCSLEGTLSLFVVRSCLLHQSRLENNERCRHRYGTHWRQNGGRIWPCGPLTHKCGDYLNALNFAQNNILEVNKSVLRGETVAAVEARIHNACSEEAEAGGKDQDRLALLILEARATDTLFLPAHMRHPGGPSASFWGGLHFLVEDMVISWEDCWETMRSEYRCNFISFTARLFATGACCDWIALCGLHLLREVLETPIPMLPKSQQLDNDSGSKPAAPFVPRLQTPISFDPKTALELLPALRSFLDFGSARLAALCNLSADMSEVCTSGTSDGLVAGEAATCLGRMWDKEGLIAGPLTQGKTATLSEDLARRQRVGLMAASLPQCMSPELVLQGRSNLSMP